MKLVLIGAGSYVFAPTALRDALDAERLEGAEIVCVDLDREAAELMAGFGRAMARKLGVPCTIRAEKDRREALPGADFVILSAAPQGIRRWNLDVEILARHGLTDQVRECGGVGGLGYSLRTVTLALQVARDMEQCCPGARLLDVTNPMPRVVTAVSRHTAVECLGFCNVAWGDAEGYGNVARILGRPARELRVVTAGLNHFAWLISVHDAATGRDLSADYAAAFDAQTGREADIAKLWRTRWEAFPMSGIEHMGEYLPPEPGLHYRTQPPYHGDPGERAERRELLRAVAENRRDWKEVFTMGSWEHPVRVAAALHRRETRDVPIINLPNDGAIANLPAGRIVEAPARVESGRVRSGAGIVLPDPLAALCRALSDVHEAVADGIARGDRDELVRALDMDPAVPEKSAAKAALDDMLKTHADLLPQFG